MRKNNLNIVLLIAFALSFVISGCGGDDSKSIHIYPEKPTDPEDPKLPTMTNAANVFVNGEDGYACYRIPTMVVTNNDVVLAFAEGRRNSCDDAGDIDIVLKRSTDKGKTWGKLITVKDDGLNRCRNQVPVVLPESNRILLVSCWNLGATGAVSVFVSYSDDEGLTWAKEKDITSQVKLNTHGWYATGPCHGIVKQKMPNKGRIVIPANHNISSTLEGYSHVIYSDDKGETWTLGGTVNLVNTNESSVTELSDGRLMLNMRGADASRPSNKRFRITSTSDDGGATWSDCVYDENLIEPMSQGVVLNYGTGKDGKGIILFSNPSHQTNRKNNTLKLSLDDAVTWSNSISYTGEENYGGYSDIGRYSEGQIGVLYEFGFKNSSGIWFRNVTFPELISK